MTDPEYFNDFAAIATSDTVDLSRPPKAVYVGVTGNIVFMNGAGQTCTFKGAVAGSTLRIQPKRVYATGTTATDLVALYQD